MSLGRPMHRDDLRLLLQHESHQFTAISEIFWASNSVLRRIMLDPAVPGLFRGCTKGVLERVEHAQRLSKQAASEINTILRDWETLETFSEKFTSEN